MRLAGHDVVHAAGAVDFLQTLAHAAGEEVRRRVAVAQLQDRQAAAGR